MDRHISHSRLPRSTSIPSLRQVAFSPRPGAPSRSAQTGTTLAKKPSARSLRPPDAGLPQQSSSSTKSRLTRQPSSLLRPVQESSEQPQTLTRQTSSATALARRTAPSLGPTVRLTAQDRLEGRAIPTPPLAPPAPVPPLPQHIPQPSTSASHRSFHVSRSSKPILACVPEVPKPQPLGPKRTVSTASFRTVSSSSAKTANSSLVKAKSLKPLHLVKRATPPGPKPTDDGPRTSKYPSQTGSAVNGNKVPNPLRTSTSVFNPPSVTSDPTCPALSVCQHPTFSGDQHLTPDTHIPPRTPSQYPSNPSPGRPVYDTPLLPRVLRRGQPTSRISMDMIADASMSLDMGDDSSLDLGQEIRVTGRDLPSPRFGRLSPFGDSRRVTELMGQLEEMKARMSKSEDMEMRAKAVVVRGLWAQVVRECGILLEADVVGHRDTIAALRSGTDLTQ